MENKLNSLSLIGSIWGEIQLIEPFPFIVDKGADNLDLLMFDLYGERELFKTVLNKPLTDIANMIVLLNTDKWNRMVAIELEKFPIGGGVTRRLTETITDNETRSSNKDNLNKVSAANDLELIVNDGSNSIENDVIDNTKTRTLTDGNYSVNTAYNDLLLMSKNNIINTTLKDVATYLTLSIY